MDYTREYGSSESHQRADIDELSEKENRYIVSLINESFLLIELSFPASCQLLTGKNLKELEADFVKGLSSYSYTPSSSQPVRKELKKLAGDY